MRTLYDFKEIQPLTNSTLLWYINQLSYIEGKLKGRKIKSPPYQTKNDLRKVIGELNQTINELIL
tara:strand:+ start:2811 stop:3005 length:195 start_codon:yes stop_codon:yes gene_type:complete